ncbi:enterobactin synthetase component F [Thermoflexales bacterium]|nr:enterobactin synthetase component F [Thermoflexales bacterium]
MTDSLDHSAKLSPQRHALIELLLKEKQTTAPQPASIQRWSDTQPAPASFAQQRLWFLDQLAPGDTTYNIFNLITCTGQLDLRALRASLNEIIRRHEPLRTLFVFANQLLSQRVVPNLEMELPLVDLSELPYSDQSDLVERLADEEAHRPFDLSSGPLIRGNLIRLTAEEHVFMLTIHHIICDAWSMIIFMQEVEQLYKAFSTGQPSPLPDLTIQYKDFAAWQQSWLRAKGAESHLAYWKQQLSNAPSFFQLPGHYARPSMRTFRGASQKLTALSLLSEPLMALSQREGVTLFMILLAAFQVLLSRYTGRNDIIVGAPVAGRTRGELEGLIGLFVNMLVMRTRIDPDITFRDLLQQVRATCLEALAHQDLPFEKIVEELHPERSGGRTPLVQVTFVFQNIARTSTPTSDLILRHGKLGRSQARFDLTLLIEQQDRTLTGSLEYNQELFDGKIIAQIAESFQILLAAIVEDPEQNISTLPLLTHAEHQQLIVDWNTTQVKYPTASCVHELIEAQVRQSPDAIAAICEEQRLTYQALDYRANQLAHDLRQRGIGTEDRVGLFMEPSLEIIVGMFGILKAGAAYVPVDPVYPPARIQCIFHDAQISVVLTQMHLKDKLSDLSIPLVCLDSKQEAVELFHARTSSSHVSPENLMYILFTSGSTGQPKGVAIEHRNYLNYLYGVLHRLAISPGLDFATVSTFSADLGTMNIFCSLCTGGQLHLVTPERIFDPNLLADYFQRHPIDVMKIVPSHFESLLTANQLSSVVPHQRLVFAGEVCHWETVNKVHQMTPGTIMQNHYGPTETAVSALSYLVPPEPIAQTTRTVPLGKPLGNVQAYVLDAHMLPVPVGAPGELYLGGPGLARGYFNYPGLTAERFVPNPFSRTLGDRLYRTGDITCYHSDGNLEFLQRADQQVKIRGFRVELGEIEATLLQHSSIRECTVDVQEDSRGEKHLVAYFIPRPSEGSSGESQDLASSYLRSFLKQRLPAYMLPTAFIQLEVMPLTPNGKVDRRALPHFTSKQIRDEKNFVAPRTSAEEQMEKIWAEMLGLDQVNVSANFFEVGGHSLLAIQIAARVEEAFGVNLPVRYIFDKPTIAELSEAVIDIIVETADEQKLSQILAEIEGRPQRGDLKDNDC